MAYRTFSGADGTEWQAWEVHPIRAERRGTDRRRAAGAFDGQDRRTADDRRRREETRTDLGPVFSHGWLAFQSASDKRRLAPIPDGWLRLDERELIELLERATVVKSSGRR